MCLMSFVFEQRLVTRVYGADNELKHGEQFKAAILYSINVIIVIFYSEIVASVLI